MVPSTWQLPITTVIHFDSHNNHHSHQEQHQHQQQHFLHQHHHSDRRAFCVGIEPVRVCRCWCVVPWFSGLVPLGHRSGSSHGPPVGKDRGTNPEPPDPKDRRTNPDPWASHPRERRAPKASRTSGISRASIPRFPRAETRGRKQGQPKNRGDAISKMIRRSPYVLALNMVLESGNLVSSFLGLKPLFFCHMWLADFENSLEICAIFAVLYPRSDPGSFM